MEPDVLAQLGEAEDVALTPGRKGPGPFLWAMLMGLLGVGGYWLWSGQWPPSTHKRGASTIDAGTQPPTTQATARGAVNSQPDAAMIKTTPGQLPPLQPPRVRSSRPTVAAPPGPRQPDARARRQPPPAARRRRRAVRRRRKRRQTPCRSLPSSHRWIWATMRTPSRSVSAVSIRFPGCRRCLLKRKGRGACLGIPKSQRTASILVATDGYQSCLHRISPSARKLRWILKKPQEIMSLRYKCTRTYR